MKFQLVSDIHLEIYPKRRIKPAAPNLILAGDIGEVDDVALKDFLQYCSSNWDNVYYVAGNHEYYNSNSNIEEIDIKLRELVENLHNVHLLQCDYIEYDDFIIAGCTLWSRINLKYININDYKRIKDASINTTNNIHDEHVEWIWTLLAKKKPFMMITHHCPLKDNPGFCTDLKYLVDDFSPIKKWCYGHTHVAYDDGIFVSNPIGHPSTEETGYVKGFTFNFP